MFIESFKLWFIKISMCPRLMKIQTLESVHTLIYLSTHVTIVLVWYILNVKDPQCWITNAMIIYLRHMQKFKTHRYYYPSCLLLLLKTVLLPSRTGPSGIWPNKDITCAPVSCLNILPIMQQFDILMTNQCLNLPRPVLYFILLFAGKINK